MGTVSHGPVAALSYSNDQGKFYSAATTGGNTSSSRGGIYSFNPLNYTYTFILKSKGIFPSGRLFETGPGRYWSVSYGGGTSSYGTIYTYDVAGNVHTIRKKNSSGVDGYNPYDGPILASNGKMYGLTHGGLGTGGGVLYEIDTLTYNYVIKQQFAYATGNQPQGRLLLAREDYCWLLMAICTARPQVAELITGELSSGIIM